MKTKLFFSVIGLTILSAWSMKQNEIKKLEWLIGTWETKTPKGSMYETWTVKNNSEFQGKSYYIKNKDTIVSESVRLLEKDKKLHYMVSVAKQHAGLPVDFVSKNNQDPSYIVFENPQNDFPQIITYKKINKDSLVAEISGMMNGKQMKQTFAMKKVK
ncbi:DUF6265 family protein [Chryseobacterium kwangjuense]|uniref:DUF6265 domain-containing protein n=1 Tax=Chryseobacterium kwangjuense TaxID=267125 RepID=A0A135WHH2_9FLAO|nr:DUF6265 family protein [Chryseobacterium kwangjuense]KXH84361.1 hypothetical protein AU378_00960 [Chryseobacterium kwangjuense]